MKITLYLVNRTLRTTNSPILLKIKITANFELVTNKLIFKIKRQCTIIAVSSTFFRLMKKFLLKNAR